MRRLSKRNARKWEKMPDKATPAEREWLDRLAAERPDMTPFKVVSRESDAD